MSKHRKRSRTGNKIPSYSLARCEAEKWFSISNIFAKSLISLEDALCEYNKISFENKLKIKETMTILDAQRRNNIRDTSEEQRYENNVYVDLHILATEYNTDPVVVLMCIRPPCSLRNRVVIK